jgi:hypothetical protein
MTRAGEVKRKNFMKTNFNYIYRNKKKDNRNTTSLSCFQTKT